jgi:hypothetical protein
MYLVTLVYILIAYPNLFLLMKLIVLHHTGVDKIKNNLGASSFFSAASIFFFQVRAKKTMKM